MSIEKNLNVIIINDFANINGGTAKVAVETAVGLSNRQVNVYYFCAVGEINKSLTSAPIKSIVHLGQQELLFSTNKIKSLMTGLWNIKAYREMKKLLKNFDKHNTVIHIHGWTKSLSISPIIAALSFKFSTIITLHDFFIYCPNGGFYNYPQKEICHKTPLSIGCILSNCDSRNYTFKIYRVVRNSLQRVFFSFFKKNINLIALSKLSFEVLQPYIKDFKTVDFVENPIDTYSIPRVRVEDNKGCVFIGRLSSEKGVDYFCEALNLLNVTNAIIVGDGVEKLELATRYPSVNFAGWQNKDQIKDILSKSRFLVLPSVWYETYGLVVQEAASYGVPCIVSNCCAAAELINDGIDGLIFQSKNIVHLADCMNKLFQNDEFTSKLSKEAYAKFWKKDHSVSYYAEELEKKYNQLLTQ